MAHLYMHFSTETIEKMITDLMLCLQSDCWTLLYRVCLYSLRKPENCDCLSPALLFVWVRALFVQLINQFFRKRISADFIVLWPTRKWKINFARRISFFLSAEKRKTEFRNAHSFFLSAEKRKTEFRHARSFFVFFSKQEKKNSDLCIPFSFFWRKQKRNLEWQICLSLFWRKYKWNSEWWISFSFSLT